MSRLRAETVAEPLGYLYKNLAALGTKRGPVLFQLPPNMKKDLVRLTEFLSLLPKGHNATFEFRNDTWFDDDVYAALKGAGAALCLSEREVSAPPALVETARWGYVRLRIETYTDACNGRATSRPRSGGRPMSTLCMSRPRRGMP